jgi:flagellar biosynthesis/type III secretory pathway protein FliH
MALQNERGALSLAHREGIEDGEEKGLEKGLEKGREEGLRRGIEAVSELLGIELSAARKGELQALDAAGLEGLLAKIRAERRWP